MDVDELAETTLQLPGLIAGLPVAAAARKFFENSGPDVATEHLPWAIHLMPLSNWIYAITAVSLLFNFLSLWSRFRLWRIDARLVKAEGRLATLFRPGITAGEIARLPTIPEHLAPGHREAVDDLITTFEELRELCRKQSQSWISDMGQEMPYRYQEHLMAETVAALRLYRTRADAVHAEAEGPRLHEA